MRAITLHQPWASLVALGVKCFETRSFPPPDGMIGRRVAIHAAMRAPHALPQAATDAIDDALRRAVYADPDVNLPRHVMSSIDDILHRVWPTQALNLPRGAVLCTAVISGAAQCGEEDDSFPWGPRTVWTTRIKGDFQILPLAVDPFGDYSPGRWAWALDDVQVLAEPVPAKGKQGWWEWNENGHDASPEVLS